MFALSNPARILTACGLFLGIMLPVHSEEKTVDTIGLKPPAGAKVLFDGKDTSAWTHRKDKAVEWTIIDGAMEVKNRTGDIVTKEEFGDFQMHIEFRVPNMPDKTGQNKGNSGIKIHGLYEIQILDSVDNPTYDNGVCGSIYRQKGPDKQVCRKAEEWQTYDITFKTSRFDSTGMVIEKPRLTLVFNGVKVHDNVEIKGPTSGGVKADFRKQGIILLQDHSCPVRFRNIWLKPIAPEKS